MTGKKYKVLGTILGILGMLLSAGLAVILWVAPDNVSWDVRRLLDLDDFLIGLGFIVLFAGTILSLGVMFILHGIGDSIAQTTGSVKKKYDSHSHPTDFKPGGQPMSPYPNSYRPKPNPFDNEPKETYTPPVYTPPVAEPESYHLCTNCKKMTAENPCEHCGVRTHKFQVFMDSQNTEDCDFCDKKDCTIYYTKIINGKGTFYRRACKDCAAKIQLDD